MAGIVVIGEEAAVRGYGLAGARVEITGGARSVREVWEGLPAGTGVAVLTAAAASLLGGDVASRPEILTVVIGR